MAVGFQTMLKNVGEMKNQGVEVDINVDVFKHSQVRWNTGLALSHNSNKVTKAFMEEKISLMVPVLFVKENHTIHGGAVNGLV